VPYGCIDPVRRILLNVSDEEKQALDALRSLEWGRVEILIQGRGIVRIIKTESVKPIKINLDNI
jgi:hypothetical protein